MLRMTQDEWHIDSFAQLIQSAESQFQAFDLIDWFFFFFFFFLRGWGQVCLSLDWLTKILKKLIWWIDRSLHLLLKRLSFLLNYSLQTGRKDQVVSHCKDLFSVQSNNTGFPFPDTPLTKLASQGTAAAGKAMVPEDLHKFLWF